MRKYLSDLWPRIVVAWHHLINFCSATLIIRAIIGVFQQSMSLAQILVYVILGGLNLTMSYYRGYLKF